MKKRSPLTEAPSGIIGLETSLALGNEVLVDTGELTMMQLLTSATINPQSFTAWTLAIWQRTDRQIWFCSILQKSGFRNVFIRNPRTRRFWARSSKEKVEYTICKGKVIFEA